VIRKYVGKKGVRWHVVVYAGQGRKLSGGSYATQKEARKAEAVLLLSCRSADARSPFSVALDAHFQNLEKTVGRRTFAGYRSIKDKWLKPYFKEMPVGAITTTDLDTYYASLPLSPTSVYQHHAILRKFYRTLRRKGVCGDPTEGAVWGRKERYLPNVLSMEQLKTLAVDYEGHWLYVPILLAGTAGLRRGEVCGLRWDDYAGGVVTVRRSMGESQGLFEKPTKTENVRAVPLPDLTRRALDDEKRRQDGYRDLTGITSPYVVCRRDGSPRRPSTISDSFRGNRFHIRFHDLRHSHATIMAVSGESPEAVRQRLGHSSVQVTLDLYTHLAGSAWETVDRWDAQWCREGDSNPHGREPSGV